MSREAKAVRQKERTVPMKIFTCVVLCICAIYAADVLAVSCAGGEGRDAEAAGSAKDTRPVELGDYDDDLETAQEYGAGDRRVMPSYMSYDENTGMPDVVPSDAEGNI